ADVEAAARRVVANIGDLPPEWTAAIEEFLAVFTAPTVTSACVGGMAEVGSLVGRGTGDVSLEKGGEGRRPARARPSATKQTSPSPGSRPRRIADRRVRGTTPTHF